MSTSITAQLVEPPMLNSWSTDSVNAENKMHELMVVNIQNLLSTNNNAIELNSSASDQLPLKYTVQDADSTVMGGYTANFGEGVISYMANDSTIYETDSGTMNMSNNLSSMSGSNVTNSDLNGLAGANMTNQANLTNFNQHSSQMTNGADNLQQVYYEHQSTNGKLNEPIYTDYQYGPTDSGQVNQMSQVNGQQTVCQYTNDPAMTGNQLYPGDFSEQMPQQQSSSSQSSSSVNSSSNYSAHSNSPSNLSGSTHSTQLLDLNAYSAAGKTMDYQSIGKPNYGGQGAIIANNKLSNRTNQMMSSSNQSRAMDRPVGHQSTKGNHQLKHHHYSKASGDRKLLRPHSTPATLIWLEENYEIADGVCIPRSTLYMHYVDFCSKHCIQPVNAASFGKIIRQKFPQLTTRRLGTRGQSRYHYYGIAVKENSLYHQQAYSKKSSSMNSSSFANGKESDNKLRNASEYFKANGSKELSSHCSNGIPNQAANEVAALAYPQHQPLSCDRQSLQIRNQSEPATLPSIANGHSNHLNSSLSIDAGRLSPNGLSQANMSNSHGPTVNLPDFPNVKELRLRFRTHYKNKHLLSLYSTFLMMYRTHCQRILDTLIRCNLSELSTFVSYFWQAVPEHLKCVLAQPVFHCLIAICDCILYKCMTQILSAPLLQSNLPENLIKILAKFSDQLEWNTKTAMCKQPESLRCVKMALSRKSACLLRRQSSLSRYICETRIALNTDHNARKMLVAEFRRVNMSAIFGELLNNLGDYQIQIITAAIGEFEILLEDSVVDKWLNWINSLLNKCIAFPSRNFSFAIHAKQFIKIWNLFSLSILKQLNAMMSPFYKIFILIRNLFNVYILYTLEYLHFDERIKEFSVSLYQDQCPQIVEPFFADTTLDCANELTADLKLDYPSADNSVKPEQDIKLEMSDPASFSNYFNPKTRINSNYPDMYSSFYNSDYYQPNSLQHESAVFASSFNASNYHCHQLGSANYQTQTPELNGFNNRLFHPVNGYRSELAQSANHHHLHHHLHQQTYHLIINNTSNNVDSSTHYHLDPPQTDAAGSALVNYTNSNNQIALPFSQHNDLSNGAVQGVRKSCDQQSTGDQLNAENRGAHYVQGSVQRVAY